MKQVQATEAKAKLAGLLRLVEAGEKVMITRHGKAIAQIVPAESQGQTDRAAIIESFKAMRRQWPKTGVSVEEAMRWRHEDHRF